jgi:hypothetical protein
MKCWPGSHRYVSVAIRSVEGESPTENTVPVVFQVPINTLKRDIVRGMSWSIRHSNEYVENYSMPRRGIPPNGPRISFGDFLIATFL